MPSIAPPAHTRGKHTTDDWITPRWLIERLGPFDLDPCESDSQPWPCGQRGYRACRGEDGLMLPWDGFWFLNPPYGQRTGTWLERAILSPNGIALIFARTETEMFFNYVWPQASALLFIRKRLTFCTPQGVEAEHNSGGPSLLVAYGAKALRRLERERKLGAFVRLR